MPRGQMGISHRCGQRLVALKRGTFDSQVSLQQTINRFIEHDNQGPTSFVWKSGPKDIIPAAKRGHQTLQTIR
jgi:hypothetical protein